MGLSTAAGTNRTPVLVKMTDDARTNAQQVSTDGLHFSLSGGTLLTSGGKSIRVVDLEKGTVTPASRPPRSRTVSPARSSRRGQDGARKRTHVSEGRNPWFKHQAGIDTTYKHEGKRNQNTTKDGANDRAMKLQKQLISVADDKIRTYEKDMKGRGFSDTDAYPESSNNEEVMVKRYTSKRVARSRSTMNKPPHVALNDKVI